MRHVAGLVSIAVLLSWAGLANAQFGAVAGTSAPRAQPGLFALFGQNVTTPAVSGAMSGFRPSTPVFNLQGSFPSMFNNLQNALSLRPQPSSKTTYKFGMFPTSTPKK